MTRLLLIFSTCWFNPQLTPILSNTHNNIAGVSGLLRYPYLYYNYPTQQVDRLLNMNNKVHQQGATKVVPTRVFTQYVYTQPAIVLSLLVFEYFYKTF